MSSRHSTPQVIDQIDLTASETTATPSTSSLPNAFELLGRAEPRVPQAVQRDRCTRPTLSYNSNYNPFEPLNLEKLIDYSPYVHGEPLFNDRPVHLPSLRRHYSVAGSSKKARTS
jgi:hypothetical protein